MKSVGLQEIEQRLHALPEVIRVSASGDGYRYQLLVVAKHFNDLSMVARQKWVYAQLSDWITSGRLHALSMQTLTESEWEKQHG